MRHQRRYFSIAMTYVPRCRNSHATRERTTVFRAGGPSNSVLVPSGEGQAKVRGLLALSQRCSDFRLLYAARESVALGPYN